MKTAALALTLALAPTPAPTGSDADRRGGVVVDLLDGVGDLLDPDPPSTPPASPSTARTDPAPSPARTDVPAPSPRTPRRDDPPPAPAVRPNDADDPAPRRAPRPSGAATPGAVEGLRGPFAEAAPEPPPDRGDRVETRTVYVLGFAALALPAGWAMLRRRRPRPAPAPGPSADLVEEAYELGRADERTARHAAEEPPASARVIRFPERRRGADG